MEYLNGDKGIPYLDDNILNFDMDCSHGIYFIRKMCSLLNKV